jgi:hypothetical protein
LKTKKCHDDAITLLQSEERKHFGQNLDGGVRHSFILAVIPKDCALQTMIHIMSECLYFFGGIGIITM